MPGKLKVTQVKSSISHIARNRATLKALGLHGIGSSVEVVANDATRGMVRQVRFLVSVEETGAGTAKARAKRRPRRDPSEAARSQARAGVPQGEAPRRTRHRRRPGQDRGSRHEGPEGARRRLDPRMVRGRPDAAPPADPEAPRLRQQVQDPVRGRQHRRHRAARRARRARGRRDAGRQGLEEGRRPDHRQPGDPPGRRASFAGSTGR